MRFTTRLTLFSALIALALQSCSDKIIIPETTVPANKGRIAYLDLDFSAQTADPPQTMLLDTTGKNPSVFIPSGFVMASAGGKLLSGILDSTVSMTVLWVANNDWTSRTKVTYSDTLSPYEPGDISADGKHLALLFRDSSYDNLLFLTNLDGSQPRLISNKLAHESRVKFSNKGDRLAFYTTDKTGNAISIYDVVNSTMITIARPEGSFLPDGYETLSWSRDDSKLSYIVNGATANEVHVINADGSGDQNLLHGISAAWSPTANVLAYDDEMGSVYLLTDSGSAKIFSSTTEGSRVWDWTLDGKKIVCETWSGDYDHSTVSIELIDPSTHTREVVGTPGIWPVVLK